MVAGLTHPRKKRIRKRRGREGVPVVYPSYVEGEQDVHSLGPRSERGTSVPTCSSEHY